MHYRYAAGDIPMHGVPSIGPLVQSHGVAIDGQASASSRFQEEVISSCNVIEENPSVSDSKAVLLGSDKSIDTLE